MDQEELLQIGVFSTLSRISVRMLRHYQDRGILAPELVDPISGYRFYRADQLRQAQLITRLRDAGFGTAGIGELLTTLDDPANIARELEAQRQRLVLAREELAGQLATLESVRHHLGATSMSYEVELSTLAPMTIATYRDVLPSYADEKRLWDEFMPLLSKHNVTFPVNGLCGAIFHDEGYRESEVDVEVWVEVANPFEAKAPLTCQQSPAREVVMTTIRGDYSQLPAASSALGAFIAENALPTGAMFNIYRVGPANSADPSQWVTEAGFPVLR